MNVIFWVLVAYTAVERTSELFYSRSNQRKMARQDFAKREPPSRMLAMISLHVTWLLCMCLEVLYRPTEMWVGIQVCALGLFIAAQGLRFWTLRSLGTFWNISIMTRDSVPGSFTSGGPYSFVRHPNYLVVITEIATLPLVGGAYRTALTFSLLNALILQRRISQEEQQLFKVPGYRETMGNKPRFLPSIRNL